MSIFITWNFEPTIIKIKCGQVSKQKPQKKKHDTWANYKNSYTWMFPGDSGFGFPYVFTTNFGWTKGQLRIHLFRLLCFASVKHQGEKAWKRYGFFGPGGFWHRMYTKQMRDSKHKYTKYTLDLLNFWLEKIENIFPKWCVLIMMVSFFESNKSPGKQTLRYCCWQKPCKEFFGTKNSKTS